MLNWFGKVFSPPLSETVSPTEKQLNYARVLKIKVPPGASKQEVSNLIDAAVKANPNADWERRVKKFGEELAVEEEKWNRLTEENKWLAVVYKKGQSAKAAVVRLGGCEISENAKLKIAGEVGRITREAYIGECVEAEKYLELDAKSIYWYEIVDDFQIEEVERFRTCLRRAESMLLRYS